MDKVLERLRVLVNNEIHSNHYTIKGYAVRCGVSYEEMRSIVNGKIADIKLSTLDQICNNSEIELSDLFVDKTEELEFISRHIVLMYGMNRYSVNVLRYR